MDELEELYQEIVLEHNRKPRNFRKMDDPTCTSHGFNPFCGDAITLYMKLDEDVVTDVSFEAAGCAISKASASLMTQAVKGQNGGRGAGDVRKVPQLGDAWQWRR